MQKYKEPILYLLLIIGVIYFLYTKIQPQFTRIFDLKNQIKSQNEIKTQLSQQVEMARANFEKLQKLNSSDDSMQKRIYEANGSTTDADSTFTVLLDDIIEMARNNHIKTHSIKSRLNPEDDLFVKGNAQIYCAYRMEMKIVTNYTDLENFIQDIYKYNYLVNINDIEIYPYPRDKRILLANFVITLYAKNVTGVEAPPSEAPNPDEEKKNPKQQEGEQQPAP